MKDYSIFIGIDVSKSTIDVACLQKGTWTLKLKLENNKSGVQTLIRNLKKQPGFEPQDTLVCMENTGMYSYKTALLLIDLCIKNIWIESALQILRSQGVVRGKSDSIDAVRIAEYALRFQSRATIFEFSNETFYLKTLLNLRTLILSSLHRFKVNLAEFKEMEGLIDLKTRNTMLKMTIKPIEKYLAKTEAIMLDAIRKSPSVYQNYQYITSVPGIGKVTAIEVIIATANFSRITDPCKFACYSGVVPFEFTSGTSIQGKSRVSHMANKHIKKALHMAAMSAIQINGELKNYYERKVAEGKSKMSVLNAVRNKLIHRMFACVRNKSNYIPVI